MASPRLLVVCGDHGMSETGSHGGSSEGEVLMPLLFVSSAFDRRNGKAEIPLAVYDKPRKGIKPLN